MCWYLSINKLTEVQFELLTQTYDKFWDLYFVGILLVHKPYTKFTGSIQHFNFQLMHTTLKKRRVIKTF